MEYDALVHAIHELAKADVRDSEESNVEYVAWFDTCKRQSSCTCAKTPPTGKAGNATTDAARKKKKPKMPGAVAGGNYMHNDGNLPTMAS